MDPKHSGCCSDGGNSNWAASEADEGEPQRAELRRDGEKPSDVQLEIDIDGSNFAAPQMKMDDSKRPAKCDGKMKSNFAKSSTSDANSERAKPRGAMEASKWARAKAGGKDSGHALPNIKDATPGLEEERKDSEDSECCTPDAGRKNSKHANDRKDVGDSSCVAPMADSELLEPELIKPHGGKMKSKRVEERMDRKTSKWPKSAIIRRASEQTELWAEAKEPT